MERTPCPHCGFLNFAISAYCARCERPMRKTTTEEGQRRDATPPPLPPEPKPRVSPITEVVFPSSLARSESYESAPKPPEPRAREPLTSVPPPPPPPGEKPLAALKPFDLDHALTKRLRRREPNLGEIPEGQEVVLAPPCALRLLAARLIDALPIIAIGALYVLAESAVRGLDFHAASEGWLPRLAEWLGAYAEVVTRGAIIAGLLAAFHSVYAALHGGQTLGRKLTDSVLVCKSGKACSLTRMLIRTALGAVSLLAFGAGFLYAIVDPYKRCWHDILCGTITVRRYSPRRTKSAMVAA